MTSVIIDLPDERAVALNAMAAAHGVSLKAWIEELAKREADRQIAVRTAEKPTLPDERPEWQVPPRSPQEAAARIREIRTHTRPDPEGWTVRDYINYGRP